MALSPLWLALLVYGPPQIDALALEQHLDTVVPARLEQTGVPGIVISVVEGDRVVLAKGWGLADIESGTPMHGAQTVVRVASISKTFTATAVAELEAQGTLDLDAPVDDYLRGLALPQRFDPPVTLRDLLGHCAGIINNNVGRVSRTPPVDGLAEFVIATMPPQVRAPGRMVLYSNHGFALAGLVVEHATHRPFAEHLARSLLEPLEMNSSSFVLEPAIESALATGYAFEDGGPVPYEYLHFRTVPASGLHTTAADMAHYMIMHLGEGRFGDRQVIQPEAAQRMRSVVPGIHPALPSYHYAFAHGDTRGHPTRSHGGSVPAFLSRVVLFDEQGVGVFVSQNSFGESLGGEMVDSIAERFLPEPSVPPVVPLGDGRPVDSGSLVGVYRSAAKVDTPAFTRGPAVLLQPSLVVEADEEGFLVVDGDRFIRSDELTFHRAREGRAAEALVFVRDESGEVRWVHRGLSSAERPPWHGSRWVQLSLFGFALAILSFAALGAGVWRRVPRALRARLDLVTLAARLAVLGAVLPYLYVAWVDAGQVTYLRPMRFGEPWWLVVVRALLPMAAALAWVGVVRAARVGRGRKPSRAVLGVTLLVAVASTVLALAPLYWRTPWSGLVDVSVLASDP